MKNNFEKVTKRAKQIISVSSDKELATALDMSHSAFSNRKKSGIVPISHYMSLAMSQNVNLNWLFSGIGLMYNDENIEQSFNTELLKQIIVGVEFGLKSQKSKINPEKKAQLIIALYSTYSESKTKPSSDKIIQFIKLAS